MRAASKTALLVAAYRARASARTPAICNDPYAAALAGAEGESFAQRYDQVFAHMELWMAVRTAYLDAVVRAYEDRGFAQVALLGAGLDTRAARLARPGVRFFEVDTAESQADKRRRLAALPDYPQDAANYVACDFERDDFLERLQAAGLRLAEPALFLWEGVTYYLSEPAVRATAHRIATGCDRKSVLAFDYVSRKLIEGLRDEQARVREAVADLGEPFRFGVNDPLPLLYEEGFCQVRTVSFAEACLSLTGRYDRAHEFRFQHFALCGRTPELP
jgi:methyltransferase (TIGR00027 family)